MITSRSRGSTAGRSSNSVCQRLSIASDILRSYRGKGEGDVSGSGLSFQGAKSGTRSEGSSIAANVSVRKGGSLMQLVSASTTTTTPPYQNLGPILSRLPAFNKQFQSLRLVIFVLEFGS